MRLCFSRVTHYSSYSISQSNRLNMSALAMTASTSPGASSTPPHGVSNSHRKVNGSLSSHHITATTNSTVSSSGSARQFVHDLSSTTASTSTVSFLMQFRYSSQNMFLDNYFMRCCVCRADRSIFTHFLIEVMLSFKLHCGDMVHLHALPKLGLVS